MDTDIRTYLKGSDYLSRRALRLFRGVYNYFQGRIWPDLLEGLEVFQRGCTTTGVGGILPQKVFEI